jgi:hypothetical protein
MPDGVVYDYNGARDIGKKATESFRSLLGRAPPKLMPHIGEHGNNLNDDVASLVRKGLPPEIQRLIDICQVVANNSVLPRETNIRGLNDIVC